MDEQKGLALFEGKARCANCHPSRSGPGRQAAALHGFYLRQYRRAHGTPTTRGTPCRRSSTREGARWIDPGLAEFLKHSSAVCDVCSGEPGETPCPRRCATSISGPPLHFVKAFGHNGYFKSLQMIVRFYNTRDVLPAAERVQEAKPGVNCWPAPEVVANINRELDSS